jgi:protein-S-isoprenylcysteine O-methyltransferase Ste14
MNPLFAQAIVVASTLALIVIPAIIHRRRVDTQVVKSLKGPLERVLLACMTVGFVLTLLWVATPVLRFADYSLRPVAFVAGAACLAAGLWCLYKSHADLGANWSVTLEVREKQQLVTHGIYRHVRHPMYLALMLYSSGLALVLPNWVAGPSYLVAVALLVSLRLGPEERMMLDVFGNNYASYMARTKRLIPGVW